jgi:hypothetical protein
VSVPEKSASKQRKKAEVQEKEKRKGNQRIKQDEATEIVKKRRSTDCTRVLLEGMTCKSSESKGKSSKQDRKHRRFDEETKQRSDEAMKKRSNGAIKQRKNEAMKK